jgi:aspartate/methionine/tyrosine aminotransferase
MARAFLPFEYLHFAKYEMSGAAYELCMSGMGDAVVGDLAEDGGRRLAFLHTHFQDVFDRWHELVSGRYGVPTDHVYPALGTSGAVHLALGALTTLVERDAPIAIETPAYPVFECVARFLGRDVVPVDRRAEDDFRPDLEQVERHFQGGVRILCVTDLHNPSGVRMRDGDLDALRDLARRHDAWIVLDEVYRDFLAGPVGTGYRTGERVVTMSSLTKCYGIGGPRVGWVMAPPEVRARVESVAEVTYGVDPVPSIALAVAALPRADAILQRSRRVAARARPVIDAWVEETPSTSWRPPDAGITGLVRIDGLTDSMTFARRLREELDVQVVPGAFFGAEGHLRISFGLPPAQLQKCLEVLALGIEPLRV